MAKYTVSVTFETTGELTPASVNLLHRNTLDAVNAVLGYCRISHPDDPHYVERIEVTDAEKVL